MPIIVNKEEKVQLICEKAFEEFLEYGIDNISLNKLISNIGISKGQFYHYFKTKEELVFEVISQKTIEGMEICELNLKKSTSLSESLIILFGIYISEDEYSIKFRKLLFDSLHLYTHSNDIKIKEYNKNVYIWVDKKLLDIFKFHNVDTMSETFIKSISATADGMYLRSLGDGSFNLKTQLSNYITDISK